MIIGYVVTKPVSFTKSLIKLDSYLFSYLYFFLISKSWNYNIPALSKTYWKIILIFID